MNNHRLVWIPGFTASTAYLAFAMVAYYIYPLAYNPFRNWLSDLGNPINNPGGAWFYNLGCVLAGLGLVVFSLGLRKWEGANRRRKVLLVIAQATNILSALCLIVTALFPLGTHTLVHTYAGKLHIFFAGFFLTFSATLLLRCPQSPRWIAYIGLWSALVNFVYGAFLYEVFIAEWAAIGLFIFYVLLVSANSLHHDPARGADSKPTANSGERILR